MQSCKKPHTGTSQRRVARTRQQSRQHTCATQGSSSTALALFLASSCARSLAAVSLCRKMAPDSVNAPAFLNTLRLYLGSNSMQVRLNDLKIGSNVTGWRRRWRGSQLFDQLYSLPAQLLQRVCHADARAVVRVDQRRRLAAGALLLGGDIDFLQAQQLLGYLVVDGAQPFVERLAG
jgi:hypothetical protein